MKAKRNPSHDWPAILRDFSGCGMTIAGYCQQKGLPTSGFYGARKKLKAKLKKDSDYLRPKFIEVTPSLLPNQQLTQLTPTLRITSREGHVLEVFL